MVSSFGIMLKKFRERENDSLSSLANKLSISLADLSAMEVGRKIVPYSLLLKLVPIYHLDDLERSALADSIDQANRNVDLEIANMNKAKNNTSLMFAREINVTDKELLSKLKEALVDEED